MSTHEREERRAAGEVLKGEKKIVVDEGQRDREKEDGD